jgi:hypothetical protein
MAGGKVAFTGNGSLRKRLNSRKLDSSGRDPAARSPKQPKLTCPECGSKRLVCDGLRYLKDDSKVQRWLCKECGLRFSEPHRDSTPASHGEKPSRENIFGAYLRPNTRTFKANRLTLSCQVGGLLTEGSKNLAKSETRLKEPTREGTATLSQDKIIAFIWYMKKNGLAESTILGRVKLRRSLATQMERLRSTYKNHKSHT